MAGGEPHRPAPAVGDRIWRFASVAFNERALELHVGTELIDIEPKPLEVLRYLLHHAGEVVTKDELIESVWPRRVISDAAIAKAVSRLRDVLGDDSQQIIRTVHGYGYRLVAAVQVQTSAAPAETQLSLRSGDQPPLRPLWKLEERLGSGGHGEAWRGQHIKTREKRVFKFALDVTALAALKREITLFRVINDTLGDNAPVVRLLDWNLEQAPYFIEAEFMAGGNLIDWAQQRGGLAAIPLDDRLEIAALVAEALGAVHSVGVLHKDLKPANVLVTPLDGYRVELRLSDFGSGAVLDVHQLESLGITRLGFTKTVMISQGNAGTALYLAPEVLDGQPFTVKADIYALGIMLYQLVVGDFRKLMSPGWERDVADELLREDITDAADGNPTSRPTDALEIARRLRSLDQRRRQRMLEREAHAKAMQAERAMERARARRAALIAAFVILVAGLATSITLYIDARGARSRAEVAAQHAQAVSEFLSRDMFDRVNSGKDSVRNLTVAQLIESATSKVDARFGSDPATAAAVHAALGRAYRALEDNEPARAEMLKAIDYYQSRKEAEGAVVELVTELLPIEHAVGQLGNDMPRFVAVLQAAESSTAVGPKPILALRREIARGQRILGQWSDSAVELGKIFEYGKAHPADVEPLDLALTEMHLGYIQGLLADFAGAEAHLRNAIVSLSALRGRDHQDVARARIWLARVLIFRGQFDEAERELSAGEAIARAWSMDTSGHLTTALLYRMDMAIERQQPQIAIDLGEPALRSYLASLPPGEQGKSWVYRERLGIAYMQMDHLENARVHLSAAFQNVKDSEDQNNPDTARVTIELADSYRRSGDSQSAYSLLASENVSGGIAQLPTPHPTRAARLQIEGWLDSENGKPAQARAALEQSRAMLAAIFGEECWRTQQIHIGLEVPQSEIRGAP